MSLSARCNALQKTSSLRMTLGINFNVKFMCGPRHVCNPSCPGRLSIGQSTLHQYPLQFPHTLQPCVQRLLLVSCFCFAGVSGQRAGPLDAISSGLGLQHKARKGGSGWEPSNPCSQSPGAVPGVSSVTLLAVHLCRRSRESNSSYSDMHTAYAAVLIVLAVL